MLHTATHTITAGAPLEQAARVLLMIHGRGASARDILSLAQYFDTSSTHLIAPQATNHTWYPHSFLVDVSENEPWLSSAIALLKSLVGEVLAGGKGLDQVYILGFSQGASLTLEYCTRTAGKYGGIIAFTGGLIGRVLDPAVYSGDFQQTPVFIGNSDRDPHVPLSRSEQSRDIMEKMGASVTLKVYPGMGHTINSDELDFVRANILA
jgi:phospholipase/carboxylesterase